MNMSAPSEKASSSTMTWSRSDERQFDTTEIEEKTASPDSNRKILEEVKKYALEHEVRYGRIPKILIFAANDLAHTSHADQLVDVARDVFGRGDFVRAEDHRLKDGGPASAAYPRIPQSATAWEPETSSLAARRRRSSEWRRADM